MGLKVYIVFLIYFCAFSSTSADDDATTEAPASEEPSTEAPASDDPSTEAPASEDPSTEAPASENSTSEASAAGFPTFTYDESELSAAREAVNDRQNMYRCMHNAPPLKLSDEINKIAQEHSDKMAKELKTLGSSDLTEFGENIGMVSAYIKPTTTEKPNITEKALAIVQEFYFGFINKTAEEITARAHSAFSQLVWKDSTELGVGISTEYSEPLPDGNRFLLFYLTSNYKPAGNVVGEEEKNVEATASKTQEECEKKE